MPDRPYSRGLMPVKHLYDWKRACRTPWPRHSGEVIDASARFLGLPPPIVDLPDRHEPDEPPRKEWWRRVREWFRG